MAVKKVGHTHFGAALNGKVKGNRVESGFLTVVLPVAPVLFDIKISSFKHEHLQSQLYPLEHLHGPNKTPQKPRELQWPFSLA